MEQFNANCKLLTIWTSMNGKHEYTSAMLFKTSMQQHAKVAKSIAMQNPYYALMQQPFMQSQLPFKWITNVKIIVAWTNISKLFQKNWLFFVFKVTHCTIFTPFFSTNDMIFSCLQKELIPTFYTLCQTYCIKALKWVPWMYLIIFDAMIQNNGQTTLKHPYLCYPPSAQREIHFIINNFTLYFHHENNHIYDSRNLICSYILK